MQNSEGSLGVTVWIINVLLSIEVRAAFETQDTGIINGDSGTSFSSNGHLDNGLVNREVLLQVWNWLKVNPVVLVIVNQGLSSRTQEEVVNGSAFVDGGQAVTVDRLIIGLGPQGDVGEGSVSLGG